MRLVQRRSTLSTRTTGIIPPSVMNLPKDAQETGLALALIVQFPTARTGKRRAWNIGLFRKILPQGDHTYFSK
jgi:hypothetical protein